MNKGSKKGRRNFLELRTANFGEYPFQRQSLEGVFSELAPFRGPLRLQNGAKRHLFGRFALPRNVPFDPHSDFPDSLSTH
jgi:hypothetical protein